ncbi:MAG TPA: YlxR family protein [Limnochordia bacterium]|nr:YlxR family protein [Limnochordia bacterium]
MPVRKPPERTCVGCRRVRTKRELIRVVRDPAGAVHLDPTGRSAGRGAYLCPDVECLERAVKEKRLERALNVKVDDQVKEQLRARLAQTQTVDREVT